MSDHTEKPCVYDPLTAFMEHYADERSSAPEPIRREKLSVDQRLQQRIIEGDSIGLPEDLDEALKQHPALEIINTILLSGMKTVGDLFASGQMQLPFVLQSAETMKRAVTHLEPHMDQSEEILKGTIVLATVKGDVHDIGKNLVDILLSNNGYRVINLGIKVSVETMLKSVNDHHADAIGMSGLLVKSTLIMKENLELMQKRGLKIPVILGGAALNRRFVDEDLSGLYGGDLAYARNAFDGLSFMERISEGKPFPDHRPHTDSRPHPDSRTEQTSAPETNLPDDESGMPRVTAPKMETDGGAAMDSALHLRQIQETQADTHRSISATSSGRPVFGLRSDVSRNEPIPEAPFLGSRVRDAVSIDAVFEYINETALIRGQWQLRKGKLSDLEYERQMKEEILPMLDELKLQIKREQILFPAVVYGYFPCSADGNDLVVYRPSGMRTDNLHGEWDRSSYTRGELVEWQRFSFPRQSGNRYLCIADYFHDIDHDAIDVCAFQIVTVGRFASEYTARLFEQHRYQDYLYMHGLSVESAEALAEYWHRIIRRELGISGADASETKRLFSQGYQGSRYSFGYPACPNLEDQRQLFELLRPERIGVELTEEFHLVPEQSTSAMIVHHSEARYFNVK